ncbi:hypothetical protein IJ732_07785 [bacterium]|nr:hypothetical protein [bacterium]
MGYKDPSQCAIFTVDVNGKKGPNAMGHDSFVFAVYPDKGVRPVGDPNETWNTYKFNQGCMNDSSKEGYGCAAWVIYNENRDYLKCNDLSWDGKTKCD